MAAARGRVGGVCLVSADLAPPPARVRQPLAVGSSLPMPAIAPRPPGLPGALATTVPARPLVTLSGCDPAGCWASDGTRLQRQGTLLLGPRGYCAKLGNVLSCP